MAQGISHLRNLTRAEAGAGGQGHEQENSTVTARPSATCSQGATPEEAEQNIRGAIRECLAVRREQGLPLTIDVRPLEVPV